jgi:hypothetical protein
MITLLAQPILRPILWEQAAIERYAHIVFTKLQPERAEEMKSRKVTLKLRGKVTEARLDLPDTKFDFMFQANFAYLDLVNGTIIHTSNRVQASDDILAALCEPDESSLLPSSLVVVASDETARSLFRVVVSQWLSPQQMLRIEPLRVEKRDGSWMISGSQSKWESIGTPTTMRIRASNATVQDFTL